jgi:uncharacterized protein YkwD
LLAFVFVDMDARQAVLILMIGVVAATFGIAGVSGDLTLDPEPDINETQVQAAFLQEVNAERQSNGVAPLSYSSAVHERSKQWAAKIGDSGQLRHGEPQCVRGGENIAQTWFDETVETDRGVIHYDSSTELGSGIAKQWLTSESHRENILSPRYSQTAVGISVVETGGKVKVYAVQRLC